MDQLIYPPLTAIRPSPFNYRKRFAEGPLKELAENIKAVGVQSAIKVRPIPDAQMDMAERYEIIFGERRYRASLLAGQEFIPAVLTEMTDDQVRLAQLAENMQREDTTPLEEAEALAHLVRARTIPVEQIAKDTGKSRSHIYATISLLKLNDEARAVVEARSDFREIGVLIAPLPSALQHKALALVLPQGKDGDALSYRAAKAAIRSNLTKDLTQAPFDIAQADLVEQINACTNCPKRAANMPALAGELPDDTCTDSPCYEIKVKAQLRQLAAAHKAEGGEVLEGEAAEEAKPSATATWFNGYRPLSESIDQMAKKPKRISEVIEQMKADGLDAPKTVLHVDERTNTATEILPHAEVAKLREYIAQRDPEAAAPKVQYKLAAPIEYQSPLHQFAAEQRYKLIAQCQTALLARERDGQELRWCLGALVDAGHDIDEELLAHLDWDKALQQARDEGQEIERYDESDWLLQHMLPKLSDYQVATALVYMLMDNAPWGNAHCREKAPLFAQATLDIATHYGIDVQAEMDAHEARKQQEQDDSDLDDDEADGEGDDA